MMVTPKVREEARNFFNCPDLEGAEIESQGGIGTAGSHWEKRVFEVSAQLFVPVRGTVIPKPFFFNKTSLFLGMFNIVVLLLPSSIANSVY